MSYQLATALADGSPVPIMAVAGKLYALREVVAESGVTLPTSLLQIFDGWSEWQPRLRKLAEEIRSAPTVREGALPTIPIWCAPVLNPRKLICIGANYADHVSAMGSAAKGKPDAPYSFIKPATTTLVGSGTEVQLPPESKMVDWEGELGVVIGRRVRRVKEADALECVAGYSVVNDLSARDWIAASPRMMGIDWVRQKAFDGFCPMGPFVTPAEFIPDPQNLDVRLWVNGEIKQESNTAHMIFSVAEIIAHLSSIMTLEPGDIIATGTPDGVGYSRHPKQFLQQGDKVTVQIGNLGRLETTMVADLSTVAL